MADSPTRAEFERLNREVQKVTERQSAMTRELEIQFQRIAELQTDIDVIRAAWSRMRPKRPLKRSS